MNKFTYPLLCTGIALGIMACGGAKKEEAAEEKPSNPMEALAKMGQEMTGAAKESNDIIKKRREKGDTLAMPYEELQKFLPESIDGFTRGEPDGATVNMMNMSYSNVEVKFKNDKGVRVKVQIIDYNQAYGLYTTASMAWTMGMSVDTPEESAKGFKVNDNVAGWEVYKKKRKAAEVTLGAGYRFWIHVEANEAQENTEFVKSIAQSIDLAKLSGL